MCAQGGMLLYLLIDFFVRVTEVQLIIIYNLRYSHLEVTSARPLRQ